MPIIVYGAKRDQQRMWDYLSTTIVIPRPWWKRLLGRWIPAFKEKRITIGPVIELHEMPYSGDSPFIFYKESGDKNE